jgi:hypothetical protein
MSPRPKQFVAVFAAYLLLLAGSSVFAADTLVMPRELVDFAHANGCEQIDYFFARPGMVNPPYVYGWLPGDQEKSAVFWCEKTNKSEKRYSLMFKPADPKKLEGCPAVIDWWNFPGGLSIEIRPNLALRDFRFVTAPTQAGPSVEVANARVLVDYYDGLTSLFYCYQGKWLFASTE